MGADFSMIPHESALFSSGCKPTSPGVVLCQVTATKDFTVKTVQKAADIAVQAGSRLYTDSASSYWALKGYVHECVKHTQKEYARGDVHEHRAECLFSECVAQVWIPCERSRLKLEQFHTRSTPVTHLPSPPLIKGSRSTPLEHLHFDYTTSTACFT